MFSCRQNAFLLSPDSRQERTTCSICSSVCFMITVFHKAKHKLPSCKDVLARVLTLNLRLVVLARTGGKAGGHSDDDTSQLPQHPQLKQKRPPLPEQPFNFFNYLPPTP